MFNTQLHDWIKKNKCPFGSKELAWRCVEKILFSKIFSSLSKKEHIATA